MPEQDPGRRRRTGPPRVETRDDTIRLDLTDCVVDAIEVARAAEAGIDALASERQQALATLFSGDFLEGLEIDRSPPSTAGSPPSGGASAAVQVALLEHLARSAPTTRRSAYLEKWLELAPFDRRAHEMLLAALARHGRIREGEEHLAATARLFEDEGLDCAPLREVWRSVRAQKADAPARSAPRSRRPRRQRHDARDDRRRCAPRRASIAVMPFVDQVRQPA